MAKFCANCGAQMDDNAPFCPNCGAKQEVPQQAAPQQAKAKNLNIKLPGIEGDPIEAAKKGNKTLFAYGTIILAFITFIINLLPIFKVKVSAFGYSESKSRSLFKWATKDYMGKGGTIAIRIIGILVLLAGIAYLVYKLFVVKNLTEIDLLIAAATLVLFFIFNIIAFGVLGSATKSQSYGMAKGGPNFGGVLYFIFNILGIGCAVCPTILKLVGGNKK
ncbi:MAG: zinc-ribbon domain-containing protein [Clostridia bacterium]|nr:zinc-ribbon domain-containing protein [Clostridia bacterium]MBR6290645.1 zinc-ribbon domain-containing protein [Clostridia bacterium]